MCDKCCCKLQYDAETNVIYLEGKKEEGISIPLDNFIDNYFEENPIETVYVESITLSGPDENFVYELIFDFSNENQIKVPIPTFRGEPGETPTTEEIEQIINNLGISIPVGLGCWYLGDLDNFDETGLGKEDTDVYGWAISNGNNGTQDKLTGETLRLYNSQNVDYNSVMKRGGNDLVVIDKRYLPIESPYGINDPGHKHEYATPLGKKGNLSRNDDAWLSDLNDTNETETSFTGITLNSNSGGGQGLDVRNKYLIILPIQKV